MSIFLKQLVLAIESTLYEGGEGVYILSGVTEKRQESEINTIVWVFQLLLAGTVPKYTSVTAFGAAGSPAKDRFASYLYPYHAEDPASTCRQIPCSNKRSQAQKSF